MLRLRRLLASSQDHGFDFEATRAAHGLDFYDAVRLVHLISHKVQAHTKYICNHVVLMPIQLSLTNPTHHASLPPLPSLQQARAPFAITRRQTGERLPPCTMSQAHAVPCWRTSCLQSPTGARMSAGCNHNLAKSFSSCISTMILQTTKTARMLRRRVLRPRAGQARGPQMPRQCQPCMRHGARDVGMAVLIRPHMASTRIK